MTTTPALYRLPEVLRDFVPVSRTTWFEGIRRGIYPKPIKIGHRAVAWRHEDLVALVERFNAAAEDIA